jgi:outer membrane protein TolC
VQQAVRAYEIAELRYREGLSTQVELADARLLLFQARASRAQAARDVQLARVRLAVLPQLPLDATGASSAVPTQPASAPAQQAAPAGAAGATAPRAGALPGGVQR